MVSGELDSVWLYLSGPHSNRPESDCWLLNAPSAPEVPDGDVYRRARQPPPAPRRFIDAAAVEEIPADDRWSFTWSRDGEAVCALIDGQAVGFIIAGRRRGVARYISTGAEAWAEPWDAALYASTFR